MTKLESQDILEVACLAGKIMLENGGEVYRVEQTVGYVCRALGAESCECYAAPTVLMISIIDEEGRIHSAVRRITALGINLNRVEAVNSFSRMLSSKKLSLQETRERLMEIQVLKAYPSWMVVLASAAGSGCFTVVFGGSPADCICAFLIGGLLRIMVNTLNTIRLNPFFINMTGGAAAALLGWLAHNLGLGSDWQIITLSALMLMVPGLMITNALRDIAAGDLVSGSNRSLEAFCVALSLACGTGVVYTFLIPKGGFLL